MVIYSKFVDVTKCIGCRACMVACKNWNNLQSEMEEFRGTIQSHVKLTANTWNLITFSEHVLENGEFHWLFRHAACLHCNPADCVESCRKGALYYSSNGAVLINDDLCIGCSLCSRKCRFEVMAMQTTYNESGKKIRKAKKCTLCNERISAGLEPACVKTCPTDAIEYELEEVVLQRAKARIEEVKEKYPLANIYQAPVENGSRVIYLLAFPPSYYELPNK